MLAALVVGHFVVGVGVVDRVGSSQVAGKLRELVDAPEGSVASRLSVGRARDPHGELAFYQRPRSGGDVAHNPQSIVCPRASRVVLCDAADGARRRRVTVVVKAGCLCDESECAG